MTHEGSDTAVIRSLLGDCPMMETFPPPALVRGLVVRGHCSGTLGLCWPEGARQDVNGIHSGISPLAEISALACQPSGEGS